MALAATVQWDVRTTGSDTNGGGFDPGVGSPGTDFSQQNSPQVVYTDLVIGATNTQLTSVGTPFTSSHVGNLINITSGTNFTTGWYTVASVAGVIATMDRAVGTAASTGGHGNLGGSLASIQQANTNSVSGNTINIKAGTYTFTSTMAVAQSTVSFIGYNATHNDGGTKPVITTATNSTVLFDTGSSINGIQIFQNIAWSNTAGASASCIWQRSGHGNPQAWVFFNCTFTGFSRGIDNSDGVPFDVTGVWVYGCEFVNCTSAGIDSSTGNASSYVYGCYFSGCGIGYLAAGGLASAVRCIFSTCSTAGVAMTASVCLVESCTFANGTNDALQFASGVGRAAVYNNIFYGQTHAAINASSLTGIYRTAANLASSPNAYGSNGSANTNWTFTSQDISLTANPFTNSGSGDYSLNGTAGGGLACINAGYPGAFPGATTTGHLAIGAVQTGTTVTTAGMIVTSGMDGGIRG